MSADKNDAAIFIFAAIEQNSLPDVKHILDFNGDALNTISDTVCKKTQLFPQPL